jgi:hypothetical protein
MRIIVELFGRVRGIELNALKGRISTPAQEEEFEHAPVDPHSVVGCHVEQGAGTDSYTHDVVARKFGFGGRQT